MFDIYFFFYVFYYDFKGTYFSHDLKQFYQNRFSMYSSSMSTCSFIEEKKTIPASLPLGYSGLNPDGFFFILYKMN